jgi:archaellum component FlaC
VTKDEAEDIKRHFDVVAEGIRSDVRLVAEGVGLANERIDRLDKRMDGFDTKMDGFGTKMDVFQSRMDGFDTRMDRFEKRMDRLEGEMRQGFSELGSMIKLSYAQIDSRLSRVETECVDLRSRLEKVEAKLAS